MVNEGGREARLIGISWISPTRLPGTPEQTLPGAVSGDYTNERRRSRVLRAGDDPGPLMPPELTSTGFYPCQRVVIVRGGGLVLLRERFLRSDRTMAAVSIAMMIAKEMYVLRWNQWATTILMPTNTRTPPSA